MLRTKKHFLPNYHTKPVTEYVLICTCIIQHVHAYGYLCVCAHTYVYICMRPVQMARGVSSGGTVGVKHLGGSKPRSGQLQWPMFKVNGGLRWLFISRLLLPCWTSIGRQPPTLLIIIFLPFARTLRGDLVLKVPVHWDPFWALCGPAQRMQTHTHARTQGLRA